MPILRPSELSAEISLLALRATADILQTKLNERNEEIATLKAQLKKLLREDGLSTPAGYRKVEAYTNGECLVALEDPAENDEAHNCDALGCGSLGTHVFWRGKVS